MNVKLKTLFPLLMCCLILLSINTTKAQRPISIELVLAVDISASVDEQEYTLQMKGIADAFRSDEVVNLIGSQEGVAVTIVQWAGQTTSSDNADWYLLKDRQSVEAFANDAQTTIRQNVGILTAIGTAMDHSLNLITTNAYEGLQMKIDISGDGHNNTGLSLFHTRRKADALGVTVNGLAVLTDIPNLNEYYSKHVISGPGSFVIHARDYENFAEAMKAKLLRELQVLSNS